MFLTLVVCFHVFQKNRSDYSLLKEIAAARFSFGEAFPHGGSLVLFRSRDLLHEVRPTLEDRYALTMWYVG